MSFSYAILVIITFLVFALRRISSSAPCASAPRIIEPLQPVPVKAIKSFAQPVASKLPASSALAKPPSADLQVSSAADAFQSLSLDDPHSTQQDVNDLIGPSAKLAAKEWIPYSEPLPTQPRQSSALDDLTSAFASLSTFDNTLEKPCAAVNSLVSSFAAFSTIDNTLEEPCAAVDKMTFPFRKLSIQDHQLHASARPSCRSSRQEPKPAPEIDDLAASLGNLSYEEKTCLRSCLKNPNRPRPSDKSVNFVTYEGHPDIDMCELRFFSLRKGEKLCKFMHDPSRSNIPHVPGDKYMGTEADGTIWLAKTLGLYHPPIRRGTLGKRDRW